MTLKDLATLLGWDYHPKYSYKYKGEVRSISVILVNTEDFIKFVAPPEETEQEEEKTTKEEEKKIKVEYSGGSKFDIKEEK
jgi:hypothetical protein